MHRIGKIRFDDPQSERRYNNWLAYSQSKLANLMFCFELDRRAAAAGTALTSVASHPGYAATKPPVRRAAEAGCERIMGVGNRVIAQSAEMGALPVAVRGHGRPTCPEVRSWGPDGFMENRGYPRIVTAAGKAYDPEPGDGCGSCRNG